MLLSEMQRKGIKNSSTIMKQPTHLPNCKKEKGEKSKRAEKKWRKRNGQGMKGLEGGRGKGKGRSKRMGRGMRYDEMGRGYEGNGKSTERGEEDWKRADWEDGGRQEEEENKRGSEGG
jgi:hypothetical protein